MGERPSREQLSGSWEGQGSSCRQVGSEDYMNWPLGFTAGIISGLGESCCSKEGGNTDSSCRTCHTGDCILSMSRVCSVAAKLGRVRGGHLYLVKFTRLLLSSPYSSLSWPMSGSKTKWLLKRGPLGCPAALGLSVCAHPAAPSPCQPLHAIPALFLD